MPPNALLEAIGRGLLRLGGWHMVGAFPDIPRAVVIAAPHSSNWDGIWGFAAKLALGLRLSILGKHSHSIAPCFDTSAPVWLSLMNA